VVVGDLFDVQNLHDAMQGVHTVFHLSSAQWWGSRRDLERVDVQGTRNIVSVARSARVASGAEKLFLDAADDCLSRVAP